MMILLQTIKVKCLFVDKIDSYYCVLSPPLAIFCILLVLQPFL